ncbi:MipA/OmpV family protein [Gilvimarinus polysaccharolyticus]|uniref:MipA/OmpV family protein n=1 Tax=Gilvimarinus polysaccharolyticus TaxID=863921 RepID=UPI0006738273|nr:MipA/OmpV family protein [Gilvimarinus polysaccharolyticus]
MLNQIRGISRAAWLLCALSVSSPLSAADSHCQEHPSDCVAIGEWQVSLGVGLGGRTNPLVGGDDIPVLLLPQASYYGERFFFDTTTLGYSLFESEHQTVAVVTTLGLDQTYFNDLSLGNFVIEGAGGSHTISMVPSDGQGFVGDTETVEDTTKTPNTTDKDGPSEFFHKRNFAAEQTQAAVTLDDLSPRRMALLGGLEYSLYYQNTGLSLQLLNDLIDVHGGQELRAGVDQRLRYGRNEFTLAGGFVWQSDALVDYYYGLDTDEVGQDPELVYRAGDSVTPYVRLDWRRPLAKHWTLQATLHQKWFGEGIKDSPLIDQRGSTTVFIGGVYHF